MLRAHQWRLCKAAVRCLTAFLLCATTEAAEVEDVRSVFWEPYAPDKNTRYLLHFDPDAALFSRRDARATDALDAGAGKMTSLELDGLGNGGGLGETGSTGASGDEPARNDNLLKNDAPAGFLAPDPQVMGTSLGLAEGRFGRGVRLEPGTVLNLGRWLKRKVNDMGALTVEFWLRAEKHPPEPVGLIHCQVHHDDWLRLWLHPDGALAVSLNRDTLEVVPPPPDADEWRHIALVLNSEGAPLVSSLGRGDDRRPDEQGTLYVNGQRRWGALLKPSQYGGGGRAAKLIFSKVLMGASERPTKDFALVLDELRVSSNVRFYASPPALAEALPANGRLVRDERDLLFHLPFDGELQPTDTSSDTRASLEEAFREDQFRYGRGIRGQALRLTRRHPEDLSYTGEGWMRSQSGAIAFWLMPLNWSNRLGEGHSTDAGEKEENSKKWLPLFEVAGKGQQWLSFALRKNPPYLFGKYTPFRPGRWVHIVLTWRGDDRVAYVDGRLWPDHDSWRWQQNLWPDGATGELRFLAPDRPFLLDDFRIYGRALAAEEVANLTAAGDPDRPVRDLPKASVEVRAAGDRPTRAVVVALGPDAAEAKGCRLALLRLPDHEPVWETEAALSARGDAIIPLEFPRPYDFCRFAVSATILDGGGTEMGTGETEYDRPAPPWWDFDACFYPSYNKIRARVNTAQFKPPLESKRAKLRLLRDGEEVWTGELALEEGKGQGLFDVPELVEGKYVLEALPDGAAAPMREPWDRKVYPWETRRMGISNEVYPPFIPIEVEDRELSVVLRRYRVGGLGLWDAVAARGQDEDSPWLDMLSAPMRITVNGDALEGEGSFTRIEGHETVYEGRAEHSAVRVNTRCTTEFDGCMKVELELAPPPEDAAELERLDVDIPITDEHAKLWHVAAAGIRDNPVGRPPGGEGDVWDSARLYNAPYKGGKFATTPTGWNTPRQRNQFFGMFIPYIWLGDHARGLAWFADNDKGWVVDPKGEAPCLSLHRQDGVLRLRVHLVQVPTRLVEPRTIVFGLMASPVKPLRPDWRLWGDSRLRPDVKDWTFMMGQWTSQSVTAARYPLNKDYGLIDAMREVRLGAGRERFLAEEWAPRNIPPEMPSALRNQFLFHTEIAMARAHQARETDILLGYFEEFVTTVAHEETGVFGYEWGGGAFVGNYIRDYCGRPFFDEEGRLLFKVVKQSFERVMGNGGAPSYLDFVCWHGAKLMKRGQGLYFDNSFLKLSNNALVTAAYDHPHRKQKRGRQPSSLVWWHREYFKRMWTIKQQVQPEDTPAWLEIHMTNANLIPYVGFMDSSLDLEWWAHGPKIMQKRYSPELLQTQTTGLQTGNIPKAIMNLPEEIPVPAQRIVARRTRFGTRVVHEIRSGSGEPLWPVVYDFGYGKPDCSVTNYWDHDNPLAVNPEAVKTLLLERNGKMLLALCSWSAEPETVSIRFPPARVRGLSKAVDPEYPEPLEEEDEEFEDLVESLEEGNADPFGDAVEEDKPKVKVPGEATKDRNVSGAFGYQGDITFDPDAGELTVPLAPYGVRLIRLE